MPSRVGKRPPRGARLRMPSGPKWEGRMQKIAPFSRTGAELDNEPSRHGRFVWTAAVNPASIAGLDRAGSPTPPPLQHLRIGEAASIDAGIEATHQDLIDNSYSTQHPPSRPRVRYFRTSRPPPAISPSFLPLTAWELTPGTVYYSGLPHIISGQLRSGQGNLKNKESSASRLEKWRLEKPLLFAFTLSLVWLPSSMDVPRELFLGPSRANLLMGRLM